VDSYLEQGLAAPVEERAAVVGVLPAVQQLAKDSEERTASQDDEAEAEGPHRDQPEQEQQPEEQRQQQQEEEEEEEEEEEQ
jgi:hypothetical protein